METDTSLYKTAFDIQTSAMNGTLNDTFKEKKETALENFNKTGLPNSKTESWKYSNIAAWTKNTYKPVNNIKAKTANISLPVPGIEKANLIVINNGVVDIAASNIIDKGLSISTLQDEVNRNASFLDQYIDSIENHEKEPLHYLNTAFLENALFIKVTTSTVIENPVFVLHQTSNIPESSILQNRIIIDVEANAQIKIAEFFTTESDNTDFLYNDLQDIFIRENARLEWYKLENELCPDIHVQSQKVKQEKQSFFKSWAFVKDSNKLRNNTYVQLSGSFAEANIYGLSLQRGKSHCDNHILIDHAVEDCQSNQLFKGVYDDNSTAVFNGKVLVRKDAQRTNAFQSNKNLLLSDKATINSKPELEIYADDVKCSHGATTGQINKDELFYLQARGLDKNKAKAMLNQAFLGELLNYVSVPELKTYFENYFENCFEAA